MPATTDRPAAADAPPATALAVVPSDEPANPTMPETVRSTIATLPGYAPGEQPQGPGWTKLNTNENPYPPSPRAIEAMHAAVSDRLKIYPDPLGTGFREVAAGLFREAAAASGQAADITADWILPGNGSDDCLTILVRTFCGEGDTLALPYPSYILYETLAGIQGCQAVRLPLRRDWSFDAAAAREQVQHAKLVFLPCPNSPSGTVWDAETIRSLIPPHGVLVLDEAYADFADEPLGPKLLAEFAGTPEARRLVVTRTLSKSYSLAGLRLGYAVAHPDLIGQMRKVKDSYNCDAIALAGGAAALADQDYVQDAIARIRHTRTRLATALPELGFTVTPSQANFLWTERDDGDHDRIFAGLKDRRVLVRRMHYPDAFADGDDLSGLRMSIGSDAETDTLLAALRELV